MGVDVDAVTRQFTSELQQVPTYEVVPYQEVLEVLGNGAIDTNQPELAFALARAVHAQAVIVGAVTEYEPYYPPRIGLHCEMYAMVTGQPEVIVQTVPAMPEHPPVDHSEYVPRVLKKWIPPIFLSPSPKHGKPCRPAPKKCTPCRRHGKAPCLECSPIQGGSVTVDESEETKHDPSALPPPVADKQRRSQSISPDATAASNQEMAAMTASASSSGAGSTHVRFVSTSEASNGARSATTMEHGASDSARMAAPAPLPPVAISEPAPGPNGSASTTIPPLPTTPLEQATATPEDFLEGRVPAYQLQTYRLENPTPIVEPWVVRHSRVFDGSNLGLWRKLEDYRFFKRDLRGGDSVGSLQRMDDFTRFACNRMIYEMLEAAGGRWSTLRGVRIPKPWEPWPWR